jgi:putative PIN family toxin of toxin-antitoxin system
MQLVLDTNVWIDWLVFNDPSVAPLKEAHRAGRVEIVADVACLDELNSVLAYPEFGLDDAQRKGHLAEVRRCVVKLDDRGPARPATLPRCSDPDDQKFLVLAFDASADWLLTRDNALLKLSRRVKAAGFCVGSPAQWSAAFATAD